jgi:hypothetical protein
MIIQMLLFQFREFVNQVIQETHTNRSSMLQDISYGRRTEIDHLNGYVVRKGRELKAECPINEDICQRIQNCSKSPSERWTIKAWSHTKSISVILHLWRCLTLGGTWWEIASLLCFSKSCMPLWTLWMGMVGWKIWVSTWSDKTFQETICSCLSFLSKKAAMTINLSLWPSTSHFQMN